jgi:hypothetical protein
MFIPSVTKVYAPGYEPDFISDVFDFIGVQILGIPGMPALLTGSAIMYYVMTRTSRRTGRSDSGQSGLDFSAAMRPGSTRKRHIVWRILRLGVE